MRSFFARGIVLGLAVLSHASLVRAENAVYDTPSLLPIPSVTQSYPVVGAAAHEVGTGVGGANYAATVRAANPPAGDGLQVVPNNDLYMDAAEQPWNTHGMHGVHGEFHDAGCDTCGPGPCSCGSCWFGGVYGLIMNRDNGDNVWLSFDTANLGSTLLGTRQAGMDWSGGFEARVGRYLNGGHNAVELLYWGIFPSVQEANAFDPDGVPGGADLSSTFAWGSLNYDDGVNPPAPITNWFDNASRHRLRRSYEFHNVELNLLGGRYGGGYGAPCASCCGPRLRCGWVAGIRYLKFGEGFEFASDEDDVLFNGDIDEVYYRIDVENHFLGGQIGGGIEYCLTNSIDLYGDAKVGLYGAHIIHESFIGGANGAAVVTDPASPYLNQGFDVRASKNDVALIGEIDLGARYRITDHWSASLGYRAVALSGVALAVDQIPFAFDDIGGVINTNSSSSLILHGGYAGVEFNY